MLPTNPKGSGDYKPLMPQRGIIGQALTLEAFVDGLRPSEFIYKKIKFPAASGWSSESENRL
jgi:hypothetical protein